MAIPIADLIIGATLCTLLQGGVLHYATNIHHKHKHTQLNTHSV